MIDWLIDWCNKVSNGKFQKVPHISYIFEHFPDFGFGLEDNENTDENGLANESLQSSYQWLVV